MSDYIHRINELMQDRQLHSVRELSSKCGVLEGTLAKQLRGERAISLDTISAILAAFPDVSAEWLMRGDGPMTKGEQQPSQDDSFWKRIVNALTDTCEDQKKQIAKLEELKGGCK